MKISFLSVFYPYRGGISQFSGDLLKSLEKIADAVPVNFKRQYPDFLFPGKTQFVSEGDNAVKIEAPRVLDSINPFSWRKTARTIAAGKPDVVLISYWMSFFAPAVGTVARILRRKGIKTVAVVHNAIPHEPKPYDKPFAKWFFRKCDGFVSMCDAVSADIRKLCPDAVIMQRPHPLYDHFGAKMGKAEAQQKLGLVDGDDVRTLLFFGLIRDYKGLDLLIDAFKKLGDGYRLVIAGEPYGSFEKYEAQIAASGCADRIKVFNKYIDDSEVPLFFSAADLCVLPYRSATQSGITAISMYFEVPIVATRVGGLEESIERPGIGLMADEISADGISESIRKFFEAGAGNFEERIREVKKDMTWEGFAKELEGFTAKL
jgi:Glycosyltransferase